MFQTWLPLPNFRSSAEALADDHLGVQRLHVLELVEFFHDVEVSELPGGYDRHDLSDHPIVPMWSGYEMQLIEYGLDCCDEWSLRKGKRDWIYEKLARHLEWATSEDSNMNKPNWFGDIEFHLSHQAALIRLAPDHYRRYFLTDTDRHMIWPESDNYAA